MKDPNDIDFTTLNWVKQELDDTLKQARQALEAFIDDQNDKSQLRYCATYLHQVQGTLRMVELYGAAMVVEEMEKVSLGLIDGEIKQTADSLDVLVRGLVQMPDYLSRLQGGHRDIPIVLLPLLNDLRACRSEKLLSETALFSPNLDAALPAAAAGAAAPTPEVAFKANASKLRLAYQFGLLKWIKGDDIDGNLARLIAICDRLRAMSVQPDARRLWWISSGVLEGVLLKALEASVAVKLLYGRVDREMKRVVDHGENALASAPPLELTKSLLYYAAHAESKGQRLAEIKQLYKLESLLPSQSEIEHAKNALSGRNKALLDTVGSAIKEDVLRVKDGLDMYLRGAQNNLGDLAPLGEVLQRVADTLGMLGLGIPRRVVLEQRDIMTNMVTGRQAPEEQTLLDVAGALLYVDSSLDDYIERLGQGQPDNGAELKGMELPQAEVRRILDATMKEATVNLSQAKTDIVAFIESPWDHSKIEGIPKLLEEISGALRMLSMPEPADLNDGIARFIETELLKHKRVPTAEQLDQMADALASIEYYLDAIREARPNRDRILDVTRRSLESLGYWPVPDPNALGTAASLDSAPASSDFVSFPDDFSSQRVETFEVAAAPSNAPFMDDAPVLSLSDLPLTAAAADAIRPESTDMDLTGFVLNEPEPLPVREVETMKVGGDSEQGISFDFDLGAAVEETAPAKAADEAFSDFDLSMLDAEPVKEIPEPKASEFSSLLSDFESNKAEPAGESAFSDFNFDLPLAEEPVAPAVTSDAVHNESAFSLDQLDLDSVIGEEPVAAAEPAFDFSESAPEAPIGDASFETPMQSFEEVAPEALEIVAPPAPVAPPVVSAPPMASGFQMVMSEDIDDDIREVFVEEVQDELSGLSKSFPSWKSDQNDFEKLKPVRRSFHTLKGSGRLVGALAIGEFSWKVENMLNRVLDKSIPVSPAMVQCLEASIDALPQLLAGLKGEGAPTANIGGIMYTADRITAGEEVYLPKTEPVSAAADANASQSEAGQASAIAAHELTEAARTAVDVPLPSIDTGKAWLVISAPESHPHVPPLPNALAGDPVLMDILKSESQTHVATVREYLRTVAIGGVQPVTNELLRAVHTLNGAISMVDLPFVSNVMGPLEGYLKRVKTKDVAVESLGVEALSSAADLIDHMLAGIDRLDVRGVDSRGLEELVIALRDGMPDIVIRPLHAMLGDVDYSEDALDDEPVAPEYAEPEYAEPEYAGSHSATLNDLAASDELVAANELAALTEFSSTELGSDETTALSDLDAFAIGESTPSSEFDELAFDSVFAPSTEVAFTEPAIPALENGDGFEVIALADLDAELDAEQSLDLAASDELLEKSERLVAELAFREQEAFAPIADETSAPVDIAALEDVAYADLAFLEADSHDELSAANERELDALLGLSAEESSAENGQELVSLDELSIDDLSIGDSAIADDDNEWGLLAELEVDASVPSPNATVQPVIHESQSIDDISDLFVAEARSELASSQALTSEDLGINELLLADALQTDVVVPESSKGVAYSAAELSELEALFAEETAAASERQPVVESNESDADLEALFGLEIREVDLTAESPNEQELVELHDVTEAPVEALVEVTPVEAIAPVAESEWAGVASIEAKVEAFEPVASAPAESASVRVLPLAPDVDPEGALVLAEPDEELLEIFVEEGGDILDTSDNMMARLREDPQNVEIVQGLQRELHTLKGGARMAGVNPVGDLAHSMESLFEAIVDRRAQNSPVAMEALERSFDRLHQMITRVGKRLAVGQPDNLVARLDAIVDGREDEFLVAVDADVPVAAPVEAPPAPAVAVDTQHEAKTEAKAGPKIGADVEVKPVAEAKPAARVERKTALDEEDAGARQQESIRVRADLIDNLVNYAGEVSIYRSRLEAQIGGFRFNLQEFDQTVSRLREQLRKLEMETEAQILSRYQREDSKRDAGFDPLELDQFSTLQQLSRALAESVSDLVSLQGLMDDIARQSETLLLQQSRVSSELQEGLMRTRMVPFDSLVPRLRRIIRQTGGELGKKANLKVEGAGGEMDRTVMERMTAPLEHMLRNALAHGLEMPETRRANGKAEEGTVNIAVSREATEVVIKVSDDGRGMDRDAIRAKAIERGLLRSDAQLSDRDLFQFILETGFSTAESVSKIAGRGVGMDVVNSEIKQLGGSLQIDSVKGKGSLFTVRLPFTLSVTQAILIKLADTSFAVPLSSVQGVMRMPRKELDRRLAENDMEVSYAGEKYQIYDLGDLIRQPIAYAKDEAQVPLVMTKSGDQRAAVRVSSVIGSKEVVVKAVGQQLSSVPGFFGATIMGDGSVIVILDLAPLVRHGAALRQAPELAEELDLDVVVAEAPVTVRRQKLVMVVDDSITMRKVTTRVLERNDMEVVTAKDGLDAVEQLQDCMPDLILLDIEMPRMDGYELATYIKNDSRLKHIPLIMITSRTGEKHRQRAMEIGVERYLGKPYQEVDLLKNVTESLNGVAAN